jgi:hypothetical protein
MPPQRSKTFPEFPEGNHARRTSDADDDSINIPQEELGAAGRKQLDWENATASDIIKHAKEMNTDLLMGKGVPKPIAEGLSSLKIGVGMLRGGKKSLADRLITPIQKKTLSGNPKYRYETAQNADVLKKRVVMRKKSEAFIAERGTEDPYPGNPPRGSGEESDGEISPVRDSRNSVDLLRKRRALGKQPDDRVDE